MSSEYSPSWHILLLRSASWLRKAGGQPYCTTPLKQQKDQPIHLIKSVFRWIPRDNQGSSVKPLAALFV